MHAFENRRVRLQYKEMKCYNWFKKHICTFALLLQIIIEQQNIALKKTFLESFESILILFMLEAYQYIDAIFSTYSQKQNKSAYEEKLSQFGWPINSFSKPIHPQIWLLYELLTCVRWKKKCITAPKHCFHFIFILSLIFSAFIALSISVQCTGPHHHIVNCSAFLSDVAPHANRRLKTNKSTFCFKCIGCSIKLSTAQAKAKTNTKKNTAKKRRQRIALREKKNNLRQK